MALKLDLAGFRHSRADKNPTWRRGHKALIWKAFPKLGQQRRSTDAEFRRPTRSGMVLTTRGNLQSVSNQFKDGHETLFGAAAAAGKIDDEGVSLQAGDPP